MTFGKCETCGKLTVIAVKLCGACAEDWQTIEGRRRINKRRIASGLRPLVVPTT